MNFSKFKTFEDFTQILEHTSVEFGKKYLSIVLERYSLEEVRKILNNVSINDKLGNPQIHNYIFKEQNIAISPSTLYYTKIWSDIISLFGDTKNLSIVEIGGGYGGQCLVAKHFSGFLDWTIYDLPEVNLLQNKYLNSNKVDNFYLYHTPTNDSNISHNKKYDLLISNYAFSELNRDVQEEYLFKVIKNCKNGYMIMNFGWNLPNLLTVEDLKKQIPNLLIVEEEPKTGPNNCLIYWKE
jgi:putative sugar O-methyltransferase